MSARSVLYISQGATERERERESLAVPLVVVFWIQRRRRRYSWSVARLASQAGRSVCRSFIQNSLDFIHENAFIMQ